MNDILLLRHPTCTCFSRVEELGFVSQGGNDCVLYSGESAEIAYEIWARATVPCSEEKLLSDLAEIGFPQDSCIEIFETLRQERILISGEEEVLNQILAPCASDGPICERLLVCITGAMQSANFTLYLQVLKSTFCDELKIVLTESARKLVQTKALLHLFSSEVYCDVFDDTIEIYGVPHIWLSEWASCVLVAPASAATIHRIARGSCDDLVSLTVTATPRETPVIIGPSMNERMWNNAAVQENVAICKSRGYWIIEPGFGIEVSKSWEKRILRAGAFGAQPAGLAELMAQIFKMHTSEGKNRSETGVSCSQQVSPSGVYSKGDERASR